VTNDATGATVIDNGPPGGPDRWAAQQTISGRIAAALHGADPVKFSLVVSMNRPGGNVTGVSFLANTLVAKQLQLLQGLLPASA
jgi:putative tryptophan/tyrosine transport system substrate-binding protein